MGAVAALGHPNSINVEDLHGKIHSHSRTEVLTVSLARVVDLGEVPVAAALVGALGVVTDLRAHAKLPALVLI